MANARSRHGTRNGPEFGKHSIAPASTFVLAAVGISILEDILSIGKMHEQSIITYPMMDLIYQNESTEIYLSFSVYPAQSANTEHL